MRPRGSAGGAGARRVPTAVLVAVTLMLSLSGRLLTPPAVAQDASACPPAARSLTGDWTTTETVDGENESLWRGTLRLVQRGTQVAGRWEPPAGQPERLVAGSYTAGVLRLLQRGAAPIPAAEVVAAPPREWLLTLSTDGRMLSGRWSAPAGAGLPVRRGDLFVTGEAGCVGAPATAPPGALALDVGRSSLLDECPSWDLSGVWAAAAVGADEATASATAGVWLLQDGDDLVGWYQAVTGLAGSDLGRPAGAPPTGAVPDLADLAAALPAAPVWALDGQVRGRVVRLTLYAGDSITISRTFVLDADQGTLSSPWPLPFGPAETDVLTGQARCRRSG